MHVPLFHVCPKSVYCSCICRGWPAQSAIRFLLFSSSPFLYGLPYLGTRPCLTVGFAFLQSILFPATISCHTTLSFLLQNCLPQSCWASLGLPFILLPMAQYGHWFFYHITGGLLCPICFPSASSALFLTLHSHRLLLSSLGFSDPITLSLILGVHGLAINPLLSLLSLLWANRGPFSIFHIIYYPLFAFFSLSGLL